MGRIRIEPNILILDESEYVTKSVKHFESIPFISNVRDRTSLYTKTFAEDLTRFNIHDLKDGLKTVCMIVFRLSGLNGRKNDKRMYAQLIRRDDDIYTNLYLYSNDTNFEYVTDTNGEKEKHTLYIDGSEHKSIDKYFEEFDVLEKQSLMLFSFYTLGYITANGTKTTNDMPDYFMFPTNDFYKLKIREFIETIRDDFQKNKRDIIAQNIRKRSIEKYIKTASNKHTPKDGLKKGIELSKEDRERAVEEDNEDAKVLYEGLGSGPIDLKDFDGDIIKSIIIDSDDERKDDGIDTKISLVELRKSLESLSSIWKKDKGENDENNIEHELCTSSNDLPILVIQNGSNITINLNYINGKE